MTNTNKQNPCPESSTTDEFTSYYQFNERGFPNSCVCGSDVTVFTSKSETNPGRPYFRCASRADGHLFKWVEEGMYEEVVDMLRRESEINNEKMKVDELKAMVLHLEEEIGWCKSELRKAKLVDMVMVGCIVGLIVYSLWNRKC